MKRILLDPTLFSARVLGRPLRPYQAEAGRAIVRSVLARRGDSISVMISRQGGKNELSAHLECYLLNLFQRAGGNVIKCAPTFKPQVINSKQRLEQLLRNPWNAGKWRGEWSYITRLGEARVMFFSAESSANVVGATAHIMLEFDEAQDISQDKHDKDFVPMGASTNCTRVYYGTAWDDANLLERQRRANLEAERRDGIKRHFEYPWWVVAECNPLYARYVEGERARLGESHPMFRTQYKLESIGGTAKFLSAQQRALMVGEHPRAHRPADDSPVVAGVDVAGEDEEAADAALRSLKPRRDSTVVTIARLDHGLVADLVYEPRLVVLDHYYWTGRGHRQQYETLLALLRETWRCRRVVVDASGVGAGIASFLESALGSTVVKQLVFTAQSKSRLGYGLLAAVNSGRFKMYAWDGSEECREFWREVELADYSIGPNQTLRFYVPEWQGHDDFLISAALAVEAAAGCVVEPAATTIRPSLDYQDGRF